MMSDDYLTLSQVAAQAPGRPHVSAVWRWCRKGVLARNGIRVKLRHVRVGARVFVPVGALQEFSEKLAEADATYFDNPLLNTEAQSSHTATLGSERHWHIHKSVQRRMKKERTICGGGSDTARGGTSHEP